VSTLYLTRNPLHRNLIHEQGNQDPELKRLAEEFKSSGIVQFDQTFSELADALNEEFFDNFAGENLDLTSPGYKKKFDVTNYQRVGLSTWSETTMLHPKLFSFFANTRLISLISEYYGRQAYYRNLPVLTQTTVPESYDIDPTYKFHVDYGLRQVSLMLLLNDLTESDTHMEYAVGSHLVKLPQSMIEDRFSFEDSIVEGKYSLRSLIGKKGTLFIFDAGNGLHRAVPKPGTTRRILHMNLTSGSYKVPQRRIGRALGEAVRPCAPIVANAFSNLI
jgi:hypothetical protein